MKRAYIIAFFLTCFCCSLLSAAAHASGLRVAPIEYKSTLKKGESKKGFIDVSNPTDRTVTVTTSVQAFRQIADDGSLEFYDSKQVTAGIKLDLKQFKLGPREALRMYFVTDGTKLPTGDVYAAIFFSTSTNKTKKLPTIDEAVRVGTILSIVNQTPGGRHAVITGMSLPRFQFSGALRGQYQIKNTGDPKIETGFYPEVSVSSWPFGGSVKQTGNLVFAGRTRTNSFEKTVFPFGIYRIAISYQDSQKSRWVVVLSPLGIALSIAVVDAVILALVIRRHRRNIKPDAER